MKLNRALNWVVVGFSFKLKVKISKSNDLLSLHSYSKPREGKESGKAISSYFMKERNYYIKYIQNLSMCIQYNRNRRTGERDTLLNLSSFYFGIPIDSLIM